MFVGVGSIRMTTVRLPHTITQPFLRRSFLSFRQSSTTCSSTNKTEKKQKVIVISGPTGAGKSKLAMELAKRLNGEIISADSVQVYQGLDVGSAKPSLSERKEVPHHLIDILHPSEDYSAGQFYEDARNATRDILDRGHVPIVAGGTGLYLRWFMYGKPDVPKASHEITSEVLVDLEVLQRNGDWDAAVQFVVKAGDPSVQSLAANDWYRLRRRLEIIKSSGSPPSAFQVPYDSFKEQLGTCVAESIDSNTIADGLHDSKTAELDYDFLCFFLSTKRIDLYRSIDFRCEDMLLVKDGLLSEAKGLLDLGLLPNSNSSTRAIGYRQAMDYLLKCEEQGGWSSPGDFYYFLSEFQKSSRNFAKRQMTWFRNEQIYHWIDASRPLDEVLAFIYDSYHSETEDFNVPESLSMKRDLSSRREIAEMKAYRPRNRHFVGREDCNDIIEWVRSIMLKPSISAC